MGKPLLSHNHFTFELVNCERLDHYCIALDKAVIVVCPLQELPQALYNSMVLHFCSGFSLGSKKFLCVLNHLLTFITLLRPMSTHTRHVPNLDS